MTWKINVGIFRAASPPPPYLFRPACPWNNCMFGGEWLLSIIRFGEAIFIIRRLYCDGFRNQNWFKIYGDGRSFFSNVLDDDLPLAVCKINEEAFVLNKCYMVIGKFTLVSRSPLFSCIKYFRYETYRCVCSPVKSWIFQKTDKKKANTKAKQEVSKYSSDGSLNWLRRWRSRTDPFSFETNDFSLAIFTGILNVIINFWFLFIYRLFLISNFRSPPATRTDMSVDAGARPFF